jgi:glycosyltransferase involved in cell wall biosynthesis
VIRVLHFIYSIPTVDFFRGLAKHHDRRLVDLQICTLDGPGPLQQALAELGIRGHALHCGRRPLYPLAVLKLARLLRRERIDVIHTHLFEPSLVGLLAGVFARTPARVMTRWYSDLHFVLGKPIHSRIDGATARLAHTVIAISPYTRNVLVEMEKVPASRVQVIYPSREMPSVPAPPRANGDGCRLGIVARLHPVKDHRSLLLAFRQVLDSHPRTRLRVIGWGPLEGELRALAGELGIAGAVDFAGRQTDMVKVYAALDVLVHPAVEEAFGFVVVEAMSCGIPVVATPRGIAGEIIRDAENGLMVPLRDPAALATAMIRLIDSAELRARLGAAGQATVKGRFSYASGAAEHEAVYRALLEAREGRPA